MRWMCWAMPKHSWKSRVTKPARSVPIDLGRNEGRMVWSGDIQGNVEGEAVTIVSKLRMLMSKKSALAMTLLMLVALLVVAGCGSNEATPTLAPVPTPIPPATDTPTPPAIPAPTSTPPPAWMPVASLDDIEYDPNTPNNVLLGGKRTFQNSCSACHDLPTVQSIKGFPSDNALIEVAVPMTEQSELPLDYSEKVIRYLLAIRYDTVP